MNKDMKVRLIEVCLWTTVFAWWKQKIVIKNKENRFGWVVEARLSKPKKSRERTLDLRFVR